MERINYQQNRRTKLYTERNGKSELFRSILEQEMESINKNLSIKRISGQMASVLNPFNCLKKK
jgi:hypothetical protein